MDRKVNPKVAVVVTVFNESKTILSLIDSLKDQTRSPDEVIIVDGGSSDDTFKILTQESKKWKVLKVFQLPGNRSVGRNYAVSHSTSKVIAFTDAGCVPHSDWLEHLVKPFSFPSVQVVSGYYEGLPVDMFQKCLIPYVLVMPDRINHEEFLPSTRSMALSRGIWDKSGGFDTRLDHNEDYSYAIWLKKIGASFVFVQNAVVGWIPRKNLKSAIWMFMRFAIGDAQAGILRLKVRLMFLRYFVFVYLFLFSLEINQAFFVVIPTVCIYLFWSISKNYRYVNHPLAFFWLPVLQISSDFAVMVGTLMGLMTLKRGLP